MSKLYGVVPGTDAPSIPLNLVADLVTAGYVSLAWDTSAGAVRYQVYRNGVPIGQAVTDATTIDYSVVPETTYSYRVQAFSDSAASELSDELAVTTSVNSLPVWNVLAQELLLGVAYALDLASVTFDSDLQTKTYSITTGSVPGVTLTGSVYEGTPTAVGSYDVTFDCFDGYDHATTTVAYTVSDPDVTAPSVPTSVVATATGSNVTVTWNASTDASGIGSYRILRDGVFRASVAGTLLTYTETGVPDGTYVYTVQAVDASANSNTSASSTGSTVVVTTVQPGPDTPANFTATAVSSSQIDLSWEAGPNGAVPTSYTLQWNTVPSGGTWTTLTLATPTSTTYSHTGRTANTTYYYRVRATANGINSTFTAVKNATTFSAQTGADFVVTTSAATKTTGAITVRVTRQSDGTVFTYTSPAGNSGSITISRSAIGAAAGDVIEFSGGTYPSIVMSGFNLGSRTNRTVIRNKAGEVATIRTQGNRTSGNRGFIFIWESSKYVTVDGSNGFPAWVPWLASGNYGFALTFSAAATTANKDVGPSSHFKLRASGTTKTDEFIIKRVEFIGGYLDGFTSAFSGGISTNMDISRTTGQWQENIEITECYAHSGMMQLCYVGSNWTSDDIPLRGVWVHHNCSEDTIEDGFTTKSWLAHSTVAGYAENAIHHNYVRRTGYGTSVDTNQRCGFSAIGVTANIYNNHVEQAGSGRTPAPGFSGTQASGIVLGAQGGPPPNSTYGGASISPFVCRVYNNISKDNEKAGINCTFPSGINPIQPYIYQNTCVRNGTNGVGVGGATATGLVKNNICLQNGGTEVSSSVTNNNNLTGEVVSTYLNTDLTLKAAQPIAADSVLNESKATTDFTDAVRVSPDKGAYDF